MADQKTKVRLTDGGCSSRMSICVGVLHEEQEDVPQGGFASLLNTSAFEEAVGTGRKLHGERHPKSWIRLGK